MLGSPGVVSKGGIFIVMSYGPMSYYFKKRGKANKNVQLNWNSEPSFSRRNQFTFWKHRAQNRS